MARQRARASRVFQKVIRSHAVADDPEDIALRIHQIAATVGVLAIAATRLEERHEAMSHALYLVEECLLDVEKRVEALRRPLG